MTLLFVTSGFKNTSPNYLLSRLFLNSYSKNNAYVFGFADLSSQSFFSIPNNQLVSGSNNFLKQTYRFIITLTKIKPKIVHVSLARAAIISIPLIKVFSPQSKIIYTNHGLHELDESKLIPTFISRYLLNLALNLTDKVVNVSQGINEELKPLVISTEILTTIQNGVNLQKFYPQNKMLRDKILYDYFPQISSSDVFLIGTVGNLLKNKGHNTILYSLSKIIHRYPHIRYVSYGDGPEFLNLLKLSEKLGLQNVVTFQPFRDKIEQVYPCLDLYVSASRQESFGMSIAEAMASQTAVVASDSAGQRTLLPSLDYGWSFPSDNPDKLASCIVEAISTPQLKIQRSIKGRLRIVESFSEQKMIDTYNKLYDSLLNHAIQ